MKHADKIHKPQQKKSSWIRVLIIKKRIIIPNHVPAESREVLLAQELRIKTERKKVMERARAVGAGGSEKTGDVDIQTNQRKRSWLGSMRSGRISSFGVTRSKAASPSLPAPV
jgi:hypothetical protein